MGFPFLIEPKAMTGHRLLPKAGDAGPGNAANGADQGGGGSPALHGAQRRRSEEHTSELQSLMRISYAVFCLKKKNTTKTHNTYPTNKKKTVKRSQHNEYNNRHKDHI